MSLRDKALEAYKAQQAEDEAREKDRAAEFAARAADVFTRQMGLEKGSVGFRTINARTARSIGEGAVIEAREEFDGVEFYAIVDCPLCGDPGYKHIATLADIGAAIENGPECQCQTISVGLRGAKPSRTSATPDTLAIAVEELRTLNQHLSSIAATLEDARGRDGAIKVCP